MNRFSKTFAKYVCVSYRGEGGDTIETSQDGFDIVARLEYDTDHNIDDDDTHNIDQSITGCDDEQQAKLLAARSAWFADQWGYCGVVISVSFRDIPIHDNAASLWGIEYNYPESDNSYLTEVANELLPEALEQAKNALAALRAKLA